MDERLAFKRPERVSVEEAATIGVGLLVRKAFFLPIINEKY